MAFIYPGGIASCNALGATWAETWDALCAGRTSFRSPPARYAWPDGPPVAVAPVLESSAVEYESRMTSLLSRTLQEIRPVFLAASAEYDRPRVSVVFASSHADPGDTLRGVSQAMAALSDTALATYVEDSLGKGLRVSRLFGACAAGLIGCVSAFDEISLDQADLVLVIAIDALSFPAYIGFQNVGAMSTKGCKPFSGENLGMSVGEGCVAILLTRIAPTVPAQLVRVIGGEWSCDASGGVEPVYESILGCITGAIARCQVSVDEIDFVYWHGTGTLKNDNAELAVASALWPGGGGPFGASTKGNLGHTMGASSALNLAAAASTILDSRLPGLPYEVSERFSAMNFTSHQCRERRFSLGLCVGSGFGGVNSALLLQRG